MLSRTTWPKRDVANDHVVTSSQVGDGAKPERCKALGMAMSFQSHSCICLFLFLLVSQERNRPQTPHHVPIGRWKRHQRKKHSLTIVLAFFQCCWQRYTHTSSHSTLDPVPPYSTLTQPNRGDSLPFTVAIMHFNLLGEYNGNSCDVFQATGARVGEAGCLARQSHQNKRTGLPLYDIRKFLQYLKSFTMRYARFTSSIY